MGWYAPVELFALPVCLQVMILFWRYSYRVEISSSECIKVMTIAMVQSMTLWLPVKYSWCYGIYSNLGDHSASGLILLVVFGHS